jgi:hypothetical protein
MMLFNEVGDRLQIVIPDIQGHVRKFCSNPKPSKDQLVDLPVGSYRLEVPASGTAPLMHLMDGSGYVLLDGRNVTFDEAQAKQVSAIVDVPKPDIIRLFRAAEPASLTTLLGNCHSSVLRTPIVTHDIVVLSYTNIPDPTDVALVGPNPEPLAKATTVPLTPITWILYSDEETPFAMELDPATAHKDQLAEALSAVRHPTSLNDFLDLQLKSEAPVDTALQLSGIGVSDLQPSATAIGITDRQLLLYYELPETEDDLLAQQRCGPGGCSGAARATQF